jgi:hypothetical protein
MMNLEMGSNYNEIKDEILSCNNQGDLRKSIKLFNENADGLSNEEIDNLKNFIGLMRIKCGVETVESVDLKIPVSESILKEQFNSDYFRRVSRRIEPPYFYNLREHYDINTEDEVLSVLSYIYGDDIRLISKYNNENEFIQIIDRSNDSFLYRENGLEWIKYENDENGKNLYWVNDKGQWTKKEYDSSGNEIYNEDSTGWWTKTEYDSKGHRVYQENSDRQWRKWIYDETSTYVKYFKDSFGTNTQYDRKGDPINESKVIKEQYNSDYLEKVSRILLQSEPPYFKMMEDHFNVTDYNDQEEVMSYIFGNDISIGGEDFDKWVNFDSSSKPIYFENSRGYWNKYEYDSNHDEIYYEDSDGYWRKQEYDSNHKIIYFENSRGDWRKMEYDENGNLMYEEDSDGEIYDNRNINESILNEQYQSSDYLEKVKGIIEPPYFYNMEEHYGVTEENDQLEVMKYIYGNDIRIQNTTIFNNNGKRIYYENTTGFWRKWEYDSIGRLIYLEDVDGGWEIYEYDNIGNQIYIEKSNGFWVKYGYDINSNLTYLENSDGHIVGNRNNINESEDELKDNKLTPEFLSKKHGVNINDIKKEIKIGTKIEMEHTTSKQSAEKIAMDHIEEFPEYYSDPEYGIIAIEKEKGKDKKTIRISKKEMEKLHKNGSLVINDIKLTYPIKENLNTNIISRKINNDQKLENSKRLSKSEIFDIIRGNKKQKDIEQREDMKSSTEEQEIEEASTAGGVGGSFVGPFDSTPITRTFKKSEIPVSVGGLKKPIGKLNSMRLSEEEIGEATSAGSVGGSYVTPKFWSKNKDNWRGRVKKMYKGGKFVNIKNKCKKFPYCNQGSGGGSPITLSDTSEMEIDKMFGESKRLKEQVQSPDYLEKVSRRLEPPYFYNMEEQYGITDTNDQQKVMKYIYGDDIRILPSGRDIYNSNRSIIYSENSDGYWEKYEYDQKGKCIYTEDSMGSWSKYEYDPIWGYETYYEDSQGAWLKREFNKSGNEIYYENSNGRIIDRRNNITESNIIKKIKKSDLTIK